MSQSHSTPSAVVHVTGLGAVTPYGNTVGQFWDAIITGKDALTPITLFPVNGHRTGVAAEIDEKKFLPSQQTDERLLSRADAMSLAAAAEALRHAGILEKESNKALYPDRLGIIVGTAAGGILSLEEFFRKRHFAKQDASDPSLLSSFCLSSIATNIAREFSITGPRMTMATVCSSSGLAMAAAKEHIETGRIDYALVVGAETLSEVTHAGFNILRSVDPERCRPFDANRKGLVLGEGAGAIVLEKPGIRDRGDIAPLGYFSGYGLMTDLHHFTAPHPEGKAISDTINTALKNAAVKPADIDYVNAHGTGTELNDIAETKGIKKAFGEHAYRLSISSIKSMIGHTLGAASIFEAIATVLSLNHGVIPPTANLTRPDPECDLDYTPLKAKKGNIRKALSNSFAFGGSNISLVFQNDKDPDADNRKSEKTTRVPVITGIGVVTPVGTGKAAFTASIEKKNSGIASLTVLGEEWKGYPGGVVDMVTVKEQIPLKLRRRLNKQGAFLFVSMDEAILDAGLAKHMDGQAAYVYGSAFGCSENVHRFYTTLLEEGPKYTSPQEFGFSVTNAPPSLVAQLSGRKGPIWVVVADEASWDVSLHYAAMLIEKGNTDRVIVSAAEEISGSILAIHHELGMLETGDSNGLILGEGAVSMVIESEQLALQRGTKIYGTVAGWASANDISCGPQEYSAEGGYLLRAASRCLKGKEKKDRKLLCISPENGIGVVQTAWNQAYESIKNLSRHAEKICFKKQVGESGVSGGMGLVAALLGDRVSPKNDILVLTSARGGMNTATLVRSK